MRREEQTQGKGEGGGGRKRKVEKSNIFRPCAPAPALSFPSSSSLYQSNQGFLLSRFRSLPLLPLQCKNKWRRRDRPDPIAEWEEEKLGEQEGTIGRLQINPGGLSPPSPFAVVVALLAKFHTGGPNSTA